MKLVHHALRLIPALLGSFFFVGVAAAHDVHAPATGSSGAGNAAANAASQAGAGAANSATTAARDEISGKIRISRSEARERAKKAYIANRGKNGITDAELSKRIKAAIHKKYEIEDDPAPPAPSDTVASASVDPPVVSASVDPDAPKRKTFSPEELAAIVARHEADVKRRQAALDDQKKRQAAADAYNNSRAYDNAVATWIDRRSQRLPDNTWGLASEYNAKLVREYAQKTGGVDLQRIWDDQDRAKFTGETLPRRETEPPAKVEYQPQSDRYKESDPRPQPPANYVRR